MTMFLPGNPNKPHPVKITSFRIISAALLLIFSIPAIANDEADKDYQQGLILQKENRTKEAIQAYRRALSHDPDHALSHYELGWSYWTLQQWDKVIQHWEMARKLKAPYPELPGFLKAARENAKGKGEPLIRVPIGSTRSSVAFAANNAPQHQSPGVRITLISRFQHYNPNPDHPDDHYDPYVFSPKSVQFDSGGNKAYVNALEGYSTLIFDPKSLRQTGRIVHRFDARQASLFNSGADSPAWSDYLPDRTPAHPNIFSGKPVESALSPDGRYLWVPYYRRDFDQYGVLPSAVAIIDTRSEKILRIMDTGPIPKYVATSPDGNWVAITHWGDNTVGLIDTSGGTPETYRRDALVEIARRPDMSSIATTDRDHQCGLCLRGTVFTHDSRYLLVGRMGGNGGVSVVDVRTRKVIGTVHGMRPTPRHLTLSPDGTRLYISSSLSGYVSMYDTQEFINAARNGIKTLKPSREGESGPATRTIAISPDGKLIYAAANLSSRLTILDAQTLAPLAWIPVDSYPVGLAVTPDGQQVWVTSQGRERRGGNSLSIYRVEYSTEK